MEGHLGKYGKFAPSATLNYANIRKLAAASKSCFRSCFRFRLCFDSDRTSSDIDSDLQRERRRQQKMAMRFSTSSSPSMLLFIFGTFSIFSQSFGTDHRQVLPGRSDKSSSSSEAYATLLYGDEFALGVRVLGKSLRDTGTSKDMVALVLQGVSEKVTRLLQADGWIIEKIDLLANPNIHRPKRFWGVYTKLKIFNMTNYKKVVYLDADTVVRRSIEDLFLCEKFCANLKHSERLNSGVMVVEPSTELFEDMMTKVDTLPSYTGGDQGFLNSYYSGFPNAHLFNPVLSEEERHVRQPPTMERLSTLYNADVGLYMLANKWMVNETELRVIHYTLGPLKPWDWWTAWLLEPVHFWQDVRATLEESLPGTSGGRESRVQFFVWVLAIGPLLVVLFLCRNCLFQWQKHLPWNELLFRFTRNFGYKYRAGNILPYYSTPSVSTPHMLDLQCTNFMIGLISSNGKLPAYLGAISVAACFSFAGISFGAAFFLIPRQVMPLTGLLLLYEWTFFLFTLLCGWYLDAIYTWGKMTQASLITANGLFQYGPAKGNRHSASWDNQTVVYSAGAASLAILAPCLPVLFGVTSLFARLGLMIGGAMVLVSFLTYASQQLTVRWFLFGRESVSRGHHFALDPASL